MSKNIGNTIYDRSINYYETDQMGIVHHSNYIRYFEEARLDMMEGRIILYCNGGTWFDHSGVIGSV